MSSRRLSTGAGPWLAVVLSALLAITLFGGEVQAQADTGKALPRPGGVMTGNDRLMAIDPAAWPWSSIGRVNLVLGSFRGHCTGTLVGVRHVLTAAHCLYDRRVGKWVNLSQVHFVLGQSGDKHFAHRTVADMIIPPEYLTDYTIQHRGAVQPASMRVNDWAILVLADPIKVRPIGWRVVTDFSRTMAESDIAVAGFRGDRAFRLSVENGCKLTTGPVAGLVRHSCSSITGESGGPILAMKAEAAEIIALNVAFSSEFVPGKGHIGTGAYGPLAQVFDAALKQALAEAKPR